MRTAALMGISSGRRLTITLLYYFCSIDSSFLAKVVAGMDLELDMRDSGNSVMLLLSSCPR